MSFTATTIAENGLAIHVHNDTSAAPAAPSNSATALLPALSLAAILLALIAPRMTPGLIVLLCGPVIAAASQSTGRLERPWPLPGIVAGLVVLGAYLAINALWAVDRSEAIGKVALFGAYTSAVALAFAALPCLRGGDVDRLARAVLMAVGIGAAFLVIEVLFDQPIRRLVASLLPFLRPPAKHSTVEAGWVTQIGLYTLNRNLAVLNFMLWPALLLLRSQFNSLRGHAMAVCLVGISAFAMFSSEHETSMLAIMAGCIVFAGMSIAAPFTRRIVLAGWVAATLLIVPLAAYSYAAGLHHATWLPGTARNRIVLWGVTAEKMRDAPILGIGVDSTKPLDEYAAPTAVKPEGQSYPLRTGRHAHNIFMQTWYELGAVGALLLLTVGLIVQGALARLSAAIQPYAYASFASVCVISAFSWGMWQPWFMAAFGLWATALLIAIEAAWRRLKV